jgi:hypothetical protein
MPHPLSYLVKLPVSLLFYLIASAASAQVYSSSISAASGGTGRAAVEAGDATFLNPATLVHLRGNYLYSSFSQDDLVVVLSDNSQESLLPASFGYVQKKSVVTQGELVQQDLALSLAEFVVDKWSVGVTAHYLEQKLLNSSYRQTNADLGLIFTPQPHIGLALVVYNVFGENKDIPENFRSKTTVGGGFNYIYRSMVRFRLDATSDSLVMGGVETYVNKFLITRLGYQGDLDDHRELITAGLGFKGPKFGLNYAYQGNSQISGDYRHSVDLEIPF